MTPGSVRDDPVNRQLRWVGLAAAVVVYALAGLTFGRGLVLAPASFALSMYAFRRLPPPRGLLPWVGVAANAALLVFFIVWILPLLFDLLLTGEY
jgi:cytochrome b subunit of formate dehydrogenase